MPDRVEIRFRRELDARIPRGATVLAAVSGGADSVALLDLLVRAAPPRSLEVVVGHLDHGLRRGSAEDRRFVERLAARLGLRCVAERRSVPALARRDESPEEAARRVRRAFLVETARAVGATRILTGHTLDDQAETVILRLVRGAGATALTGMAAEGPGPFVRPLLQVETAELRAYLARRGLHHREDSSNRSLRFDRNRVRHLVVPLLRQAINPRAPQHIVQAAARLREDACYLDAEAEILFGRLATVRRGRVAFDVAVLGATPVVLARRLVRLALVRAGADPRRVHSRHIADVLHLAAARPGARLDLPGGLRARRNGSRLRIGSIG